MGPWLLAVVFQGVVGLAWFVGLDRLARPLPARLRVNLLAAILVAPPVLAAARLLGLGGPPRAWALLRADRWWALLEAGGWPAMSSVGFLFGGSALIGVVQEVVPNLALRVGLSGVPHVRDARLEAILAELPARPWGRPLAIRRLETDRRLALLQGLSAPTILVSRGLMRALDEAELKAVVAHELAHHHRGGNRRRLLLWLFRLAQLPSPAALVAFRWYLGAEEVACDALAARWVRPVDLASALLRIHGRRPPASAGAWVRARHEVARRAEVAATRERVRALLDGVPVGGAGASLVLVLVAMLLTWGVAA